MGQRPGHAHAASGRATHGVSTGSRGGAAPWTWGSQSLGSPTKKARGAGGEEKRPKNKPTRAERNVEAERGGLLGGSAVSASSHRGHQRAAAAANRASTAAGRASPPLSAAAWPGLPGRPELGRGQSRAEGVSSAPAPVPSGPGRPGRKGGARRSARGCGSVGVVRARLGRRHRLPRPPQAQAALGAPHAAMPTRRSLGRASCLRV